MLTIRHANLFLSLLTRLIAIVITIVVLAACDSDEEVSLCDVSVGLIYPEESIEPYAGARVEMKDATSSVFVSTTDNHGKAHFLLPPGIYEASSNAQYLDTIGTIWWRYIFNGVRSQIIVSPDSTNNIQMNLKMSRKRIVH